MEEGAWRLPTGGRQAPLIGARPPMPSCHPSRWRLAQIPNLEEFVRRPPSVFLCGTQQRCPAFCESRVHLPAGEAARAEYSGRQTAAPTPLLVREGLARLAPAAPGLNAVFERAALAIRKTAPPAHYHAADQYQSSHPPLYARLIISCFPRASRMDTA